MTRPIRVLVAKPGLDGHDRGAKVVAAALRDAGMEVIYTGLHQTPEMIATAAVQEDVDVVGLSILSGAHMTLFPRVRDLLAEIQGLEPRTAVSFSFRVTRSNASIGRVLEGLRSVRLLDMFSNVICDAGMALLSRAIPSLVTLRCLDLTSNLISHAGMARLAPSLAVGGDLLGQFIDRLTQ